MLWLFQPQPAYRALAVNSDPTGVDFGDFAGNRSKSKLTLEVAA
jgi:hypothetical protein